MDLGPQYRWHFLPHASPHPNRRGDRAAPVSAEGALSRSGARRSLAGWVGGTAWMYVHVGAAGGLGGGGDGRDGWLMGDGLAGRYGGRWWRWWSPTKKNEGGEYNKCGWVCGEIYGRQMWAGLRYAVHVFVCVCVAKHANASKCLEGG